jgi:hypothetical protein
MTRCLFRHPDTPVSPVELIEVDALREKNGEVTFFFVAFGKSGDVRLPRRRREPHREDELWRHTCFEVFLAPLTGELYYEFNFSPSRAWAAYRFDSCRTGMARPEIDAPRVQSKALRSKFGVTAALGLASLPELMPLENWRIGISAVIEAEDGGISHWALAHPPGKPDFHHPDCFAAELAPAALL